MLLRRNQTIPASQSAASRTPASHIFRNIVSAKRSSTGSSAAKQRKYGPLVMQANAAGAIPHQSQTRIVKTVAMVMPGIFGPRSCGSAQYSQKKT